MQKFQDYFLIHEVANLDKTDVSDVELRCSSDHCSYRYEIDDVDYRISFARSRWSDDRTGETVTDNKWEIFFSADDDMNPTGKGTPHQVYTEMLKGMKKFLQERDPEALHFEGYKSAMDLVYRKFYNRYLSDKPGRKPKDVFMNVGNGNYLRKDIYEELNPTLRASIDEKMKARVDYEDRYYQQKKEEKATTRQTRQKAKGYLGKFISGTLWGQPRAAGFVYEITSEYLKYIRMYGDRAAHRQQSLEQMGPDALMRYLGDPREISPQDVSGFDDVQPLIAAIMHEPVISPELKKKLSAIQQRPSEVPQHPSLQPSPQPVSGSEPEGTTITFPSRSPFG